MSEVIENYIRRHPEQSEKDAFEGFLQEDRIKAWVGSDDGRRERLRKEFGRVWGSMHVEGKVAQGARVGPSGPTGPQYNDSRGVRVQVQEEAQAQVGKTEALAVVKPKQTALQPIPAMQPGARRLGVMCTACRHVNVWMDGHVIACRTCGRVYDDMLQLIRVTPVGPFEFLFGEGWQGVATAAGIGLLLIALYGVLRWV